MSSLSRAPGGAERPARLDAYTEDVCRCPWSASCPPMARDSSPSASSIADRVEESSGKERRFVSIVEPPLAPDAATIEDTYDCQAICARTMQQPILTTAVCPLETLLAKRGPRIPTAQEQPVQNLAAPSRFLTPWHTRLTAKRRSGLPRWGAAVWEWRRGAG